MRKKISKCVLFQKQKKTKKVNLLLINFCGEICFLFSVFENDFFTYTINYMFVVFFYN